MNFKDKYEYYNFIKSRLEENGVTVSDFSEISYGLQFGTVLNEEKGLIRVYESKKGVKGDFSQIKSGTLYFMLLDIANQIAEPEKKKTVSVKKEKKAHDKHELGLSDIDANPLIGTDESGKGDYFGPLVIAGVYADEDTKKILRAIGADDSKKLSDVKIAEISKKIKELCKYSVVVIGNEKYNELYGRISNLNRLLAWGHARVIENILNETDCNIALSDQFGNPQLIKSALLDKGKKIHLEQRPRAEENVVVAAASILARNEFVERVKALSLKYGIKFPKGASDITKQAGKEFVEKFGKEKLNCVAKLHFKTTLDI
ncbi:MAG TPA: ribonuclease HIII [Clostridia bacterium]